MLRLKVNDAIIDFNDNMTGGNFSGMTYDDEIEVVQNDDIKTENS